ncbi:lipoprotein [Actinocrispum wychmicini]|uniref:DUF4352 domain-containing protein n=1 Tax=Actinocrispum wychmicini TaxID=1213861 RepID=A0A4R2J3H2_9PSEU|nr:hypothetical protein [Actinocrispum wychmicini]TCO53023.1 hypothetical protein EV192_111220 [Actinocrispum wychmicini]
MKRGLLLTVAAVALAGCSASGTPAPPPPPATPTYELPARPVRPDEKPVTIHGQDGDTEYDLIGLTVDQPSLAGSHIEFNAQGAYTRIRLVIVNTGRSGTQFDTKKQLLVGADDKTYAPDEQAMLIKRQPWDPFLLGASDRLEFDLYYDIPKGTKAKALRAFGGATLTDGLDEKSTDIPLPA